MKYAADLHLKSICIMPGELTFPAAADVELPGHVEVLLVEVPSPTMYRGPSAQRNTLRWALRAMHDATLLSLRFPVLVSPSGTWTRGYEKAARQLMAGATAKNEHLRDAEAMIWFFTTRPQDWVPLADYVASL